MASDVTGFDGGSPAVETQLPLRTFATRAAYEAGTLADDGLELATAAVAQRALAGYCLACATGVVFEFPRSAMKLARAGIEPDWREGAICPRCRLSARQRLAWHAFLAAAHGSEAAVYATEAITPFQAHLRQHVRRLVSSEYLATAERGEQVRIGDTMVENQDLTGLTYDDRAFDAIFCLDVLEHVPDYHRALAELHRVLAPGGQLILSAPFSVDRDETVVRARVEANGAITHLLAPEYHGDPVRGRALCFYHFGWDVLDLMRDIGFTEVALTVGRSDRFGYFSRGCVHLTASR